MTYAFMVTTIGPCNASIDRTFHAGARLMGLLISAHFAGFIVSTFIAGYLIDRLGLKPLLVGGVALLGAAQIGFGLSCNLAMLFGTIFLAGVGGGAVESGVNALISRLYSETRVYSLNMLHMFFGIGAFTWPTAAGYLLESGVSWRSIYFITGGFTILMSLAMLVQGFPAREPGAAVRFREIPELLKRPVVLLLGCVMALYVGGEMGINGWIVRYFEEDLHFTRDVAPHLRFAIGARVFNPPLTASVFLTLYWFMMTLGRVISTIVGRFVPDYKLLRAVAALSAAAGLATFLVDSVPLAAVFLGLTGLFFSGIFPTVLATGANRAPDRIGLVSGLLIGFSGIGNVILNYGIGEISQRAGSIRYGMLFVAVLLLGMAACAFAIGPAKKESGRIQPG
jgi:fucose permease